MNNAEKYIYAVYQTNSFSKAAKKMFVSQPALSAAIIKHEKELGFNIFNRTPTISLTKEGEAYIDYLQESIDLENKLKQRIQSFHNITTKVVSIGGSNSAAAITIPKLCKEFSRKYPDVNIKIDIGETSHYNSLFDKLDKGTIDFVITSNFSSPKYNSVLLWKEKYLLVMRKDFPDIQQLGRYSLLQDEILSGIYPKEKEISNWSLFKNINVFKPGTNRKGWKIFADFFNEASCKKCYVYNFRNLDMNCRLMEEGLGAAVLPQSTIFEKGYNSQNFLCFAIASDNNLREVMLVYKKDALLTEYTKGFIEISKNRFPFEMTIGELLGNNTF